MGGITVMVKKFRSKCSICRDTAYYCTRQIIHGIPRYRFYCENHMKEVMEKGLPKGTFLYHIKYEGEDNNEGGEP
jgi:hypothetical protein